MEAPVRVQMPQNASPMKPLALYGRVCVDEQSKWVGSTAAPKNEMSMSLTTGHAAGKACKAFLPNIPEDHSHAPLILSTLLDEKGSRQGVFVQLVHTPRSEKGLDNELLGKPDGIERDVVTKNIPNDQGGSYETELHAKPTTLFQRFAELLPYGLAVLDREADAIFVNDGFFKLTTKRDENNFRSWPESIDPRDHDRVMTAYREAFSKNQELRIEFRCPVHGEEQWRLFLLRPLKDDADTGFICAVIDITDLKRAEITQAKAAVEAQERKDQQERFIDMVSHEIRNPLSAVLHLADEIKGASSSLREKIEEEMLLEINDAADTILLCVQHQNVLVDDILSFSKLDAMMLSLLPSVVQPKWDFSSALKVFQSELKSKNIGFHYALDVSYEELNVDYVIADNTRIKQVLINLLTNAIKFTAKKKGTKHISVAMGATVQRPTSYPPNVVFFETKEGQFHYDSTTSTEWGQGPNMFLMVAVKDTGIGISASDQKKLFERFMQATPKTQENYGGSGLGLFISRKICQLHGGDIGVSSKEGTGSTFGFFFKVRRADASDTLRPPFNRQRSSQSPAKLAPSPKAQEGSLGLDGGQQEVLAYRSSLRLHSEQQTSYPGMQESRYTGALPNNSQVHGGREEEAGLSTQFSSDYPCVGNVPENPSLIEPPVEFRDEAHPSSSTDDRYDETAGIVRDIQERPSVIQGIQNALPESLAKGHGETERQAFVAAKTSKQHQQTQDEQAADALPTTLLVEDNLINQKVLRRQLQARGFQVSVANNGQEAIDSVMQKAGEAANDPRVKTTFDCILMDQEMPIKDGNAATMEIRDFEENGHVAPSVILGVTANVREAQRSSMLQAGMDDVISKPYKIDELVERIKNLLSSR